MNDKLAKLKTGRGAGFTLIELLVVIALTGLLLALILGPLIQAFRLTNKARALGEAQDATRFGMERLRRELSQAAYVYDNTNTPLVLPLDLPAPNNRRDLGLYPVIGGNPDPRPQVQYTKIDFVPAATEGEGPNTAIDPTTDKPLGGTRLALPAGPGQRIVRYFVGLRNNLPKTGQNLAFYENVYEFPRTDTDTNTFILYRAEFDPTDPNLFDQTAVNGQPRWLAQPFGSGGLHDPNFFYNLNAANTTNERGRAGNGRPYAENWRAVAGPILSSTNLDVLGWRRGDDKQVTQGSPFQVLVNFAPSTVVGDTAAPGFLSNTQAEAPGAVPTLYTAKFNQWVFPFTVTIYRGATEYAGDDQSVPAASRFGRISFTFQQVDQGNGLTVVQCTTDRGVGRLATNEHYWLQDAVTGKFHVFSDGLAFTVDPARGRVETAFAPVANSATQPNQPGIPLFLAPGATNPAVLNPGPVGNFGQLVPLVYRRATLDTDNTDEARYGERPLAAGETFTDANGNTSVAPRNQGIIRAELFDRAGGNIPPYHYFPITGNLAQGYWSPFNAFGTAGGNAPFRGIMMVPGSELVMGPESIDVELANNVQMVSYYRVPLAVGTLAKRPNPINDAAGTRYVWSIPMNYRIAADLGDYPTPYLQFDEPVTTGNAPATSVAGIPARSGNAQLELRVSYLWQNNYARNGAGEPTNAQGEVTTGNLGGQDRNRVRPEADVFKVDYQTRSLMNTTVGARVYDVSTKVPQSASVTDRVPVNNVAR
jgi:prepilin-type N-terminal cleavage/methylation domain-containing protein